MKLRVRLFVRLLVGLLVCSSAAQAQVTITGVTPASVCVGSTVTISYSLGYTEQFDVLNLYAYLYRSTADSVEIAHIDDVKTIRSNNSISATIPSNQVQTTGGYTIKLKLTRKPTVGEVSTFFSQSTLFITATPPAPSVSDVKYCQNDKATALTGTPTVSGGILYWSLNSTDPGSPSVTPSTSAPGTTSYYVRQSVNNCVGQPVVQNVTVNALPDAPTITYSPLSYCQGTSANPLPSSLNGSTLTWYTTQTGNNPLINLTPQTNVTGTTSYSVSQTNSNGCISPRNSITIQVNSRPALPSVTNPAPYCPDAMAALLSATALTGNTLKWYGTDATGGMASLTATQPSTQNTTTQPLSTLYYVSQVDGNTCESDRASITVTVNPKPGPPTVVPLSACQNTTPPSLTNAVTSYEGSLKWYSPANTSLVTAPVLSSSATGPFTYYVTNTNQYNCESAQATITYTVKSLPSAPTVAPNPVVLCQSSVAGPLSATGTGTYTLNWYDPGNNVYSSISPNTANVGPTVYWVTQTVDGCESLPTSLTVIVIAKPNAPTVNQPAPYCQLSPAVSLSLSATGQRLKWYTTPNGRPASFSETAPIPPTDKAGTFPYYVTQTDNNTCESDPAIITVQVKPKPAKPGTAPISFCANGVVPLTATYDSGAGGSLLWYGTDPTNKNPTTTAPTPATTVIGAPVTYYVSQTVNGCESDQATLAVTINALPAQPRVSADPVYYCLGAAASPLSATADTGGSLIWYASPTSTAPLSGTPTPSTTSTNPLTTNYYVSQRVNGCEGPRSSIAVTINPLPQTPLVTATQTYCQSLSLVTLSATATNTNALTWYDRNGAVTSPTISAADAGTTTYSVSQTDASTKCVSEKATVTVTITATPRSPASATVTVCLNTPPRALTATNPDGGSLIWYRDPVGGSSSTTAPSPPTSVTGTTTYYVSQLVGTCEGPRASITVVVSPLPPKPTVVSSLSLCQNSPAQSLSATGTGILYWYNSNGTSSTQAPTIITSTLGSTTYSVSQQVDGCESLKESITVTIKPQPVQPMVSSNPLIVCQNTTTPVALTATPSTGGTLNWYGTNPAGPSSPLLATPVVTTAGTFTYYVSQSVNSCESPQAPIIVFVQATPARPTIGAAPVYCQGGTASTLSATASAGGILNWYTTEVGGSPLPAPPSPPINAAGTFTAFVSQSINGCEGLRATVTATIRAAPNPPNPATFTLCQNTPATSLTAAANGGTLTWYEAPTGGSGSTIAPTPPTTDATTIYRYVSLTDTYGCESSRATITVRVNPQPNAPTTTGLTVCQSTAAPALTQFVGATGTLRWYTSQTGGTPSSTPPVLSTASPGNQLFFVSQTDAVTGCESPRNLLLATVTPTPSAPVLPTIGSLTACQGPTPVVLTAAGSNLKWYADNTSTTPISQGSSFSQSAAQPGPFTYFISQTVSSCESPRIQIQGVVNPVPAVPAVTPIQSGCQDVQAQPLTAIGTALQWYNQNDELIGTPTPNTRVDATQTTTYRVTQTVNGCTSPKAFLTYTVNVTAPPLVASPVDFCQTQAIKLLTAVGTNLKWYDPSGNVTTGLVTTAGSYSVTQTVQGCESRKKEIVVTISPQATATLAGSASISQGSSTTLTLTGTGSFTYVLSDGTTGTVVSTSPAGTTVRQIVVTPGATTTYTMQSISNGCGNGIVSGSALVTVTIPTITTGALSETNICAGSPLSVSFTSTGTFAPGNTFTAEIAPFPGTSTAPVYVPLPTSGVPGQPLTVQIPKSIASGKYQLRINASNATYPIPGTPSSMTLTVRSLPTASLSTASSMTTGSIGGKTQPVELLINLSGERPWSVTYTATTATSTLQSTTITDTNPYRLLAAPDMTTTYRLLAVSSSNGCGLGRIEAPDSIKITVNLVTAAEPDPFSNTVKVYPVPTNGAVTIDIDLPLPQPAQLRLTNLDGQTTQQFTTRQRQTTLTLDKEPGGTYLLYIKIGDKWTVRRILKW